MTFTHDAWARIEPVRTAIDDLPFLKQLKDGSLDREVFTHYLAQDGLYLADYGRVLAAAASQSTDPDELLFWAGGAQTTVKVERELHGSHVADLGAATKSPVCTAYTSYLFSVAASGCYPALTASVLPCFWIYEDVGRRLLAEVGSLEGHPYADWISTYGDPEFAESVRKARAVVDRQAELSSPAVVERMHEAFETASRYEWMFWEAPSRLEGWPV